MSRWSYSALFEKRLPRNREAIKYSGRRRLVKRAGHIRKDSVDPRFVRAAAAFCEVRIPRSFRHMLPQTTLDPSWVHPKKIKRKRPGDFGCYFAPLSRLLRFDMSKRQIRKLRRNGEVKVRGCWLTVSREPPKPQFTVCIGDLRLTSVSAVSVGETRIIGGGLDDRVDAMRYALDGFAAGKGHIEAAVFRPPSALESRNQHYYTNTSEHSLGAGNVSISGSFFVPWSEEDEAREWAERLAGRLNPLTNMRDWPAIVVQMNGLIEDIDKREEAAKEQIRRINSGLMQERFLDFHQQMSAHLRQKRAPGKPMSFDIPLKSQFNADIQRPKREEPLSGQQLPEPAASAVSGVEVCPSAPGVLPPEKPV